MRKVFSITFSLVLLFLGLVSSVMADQQTSIAGKQVIVARFTHTPVRIDGFLGPAEWREAIPVYVTATHPGSAPGVVPTPTEWYPCLLPPDNPRDLSFTIRTLYDSNNLYVAVEVVDDILIHDSCEPGSECRPWLDDDVEVFIDGDKQPGDFSNNVFCPPGNTNCVDTNGNPYAMQNKEGFQLITSVGDDRMTVPDNPNIVWESRVGLTPRGYVVEFRIPLDSISTNDTSWWTGGHPGFRRPRPGDSIGFNVGVGDDDNGGDGYLLPFCPAHSNSYLAWDGNSLNWSIFNEQDWGILYFLP